MSKNEDLTRLRKHYRDQELYLAWLSRKGMSEEAYLLAETDVRYERKDLRPHLEERAACSDQR